MINSPCAHFLPSINKRLSDTPELSKQYCVLDVKYTAVFRERLSKKMVRAFVTMPKGCMGDIQ